VYSPPRHCISSEEYEEYLSFPGPQFIAAGDWNAKHVTWESRLTTTKGRNLLRAMTQLNIKSLSTGEPTYWPIDKNKTPDLLDFVLIKGFSDTYTKIEGNLDLISDHSALSTNAILKESIPRLCSQNTDWSQFGDLINNNINLQLRLKEQTEIRRRSAILDNPHTKCGVASNTCDK
jgi:hypothetical protein